MKRADYNNGANVLAYSFAPVNLPPSKYESILHFGFPCKFCMLTVIFPPTKHQNKIKRKKARKCELFYAYDIRRISGSIAGWHDVCPAYSRISRPYRRAAPLRRQSMNSLIRPKTPAHRPPESTICAQYHADDHVRRNCRSTGASALPRQFSRPSAAQSGNGPEP